MVQVASCSAVGWPPKVSYLADWAVVGPATETAPGQFEFTDPDAPDHATCFYRLRSP